MCARMSKRGYVASDLVRTGGASFAYTRMFLGRVGQSQQQLLC